MDRPWRSALYVPASNARAAEKACGLPCDAILYDLEDAVAPAEKDGARAALAAILARDHGHRARIVRINGADTPWGDADATALADLPCEGVLLPKVSGPEALDRLAARVPHPLWAMIETPAGVLGAAAIAAHPRVAGLVAGTNDLARDLGARPHPAREPLLPALGQIVLAARAQGRVALDGVYNALRDEDGLAAECAQGRHFGFDGKTLIHPAQIAAANAAFSPTGAEIDLARRQIEAHEAAEAAGQGVAVLDGRIVESLHVAAARATLAQARAIAELESP
ncbi:HpcH/HpaI aldolase/citrate lyase family protein [Wenxinia saemankumensis]|uniref:(3S)-malyl-CoA thioesterase n=1 Tax=Wenxinia saemankumensis TaxID=1447782 RepID=A0A1M6EMS5_9RHOB|nr:CoA ester lyase [Wenxinia saemankumensis]SHI86744.1 (3S)-malyl-CoA thioesterase [Wenxinia saemankumensis]